METQVTHQFILYPELYQMRQFARDAHVEPMSTQLDQFISTTYSPEAIVMICPQQSLIEGGALVSSGWRVLQLYGPFNPDDTSLLSGVARMLRESGASLHASSAPDTDYLLVPHSEIDAAVVMLKDAGYGIREQMTVSVSA